jgi:hypothetical protein
VTAPDLRGCRTGGAHLGARIAWLCEFPFLLTDSASLGAILGDLVALELALRQAHDRSAPF